MYARYVAICRATTKESMNTHVRPVQLCLHDKTNAVFADLFALL